MKTFTLNKRPTATTTTTPHYGNSYDIRTQKNSFSYNFIFVLYLSASINTQQSYRTIKKESFSVFFPLLLFARSLARYKYRYIIPSGVVSSFSSLWRHSLFPNHICGSIHHSYQCLSAFLSYFGIFLGRQSVMFVLFAMCTIVLIHVTVFNSSYVNVNVLSAFHVSTSMFEPPFNFVYLD